MKDKSIFLVTPDFANKPSFGYRCKKSFETLGYKVHTFNYRQYQLHRLPVTNDILNKKILSKALTINPDLMFVVKGEKFNKGIIEKISNSRIKTVNWCLDDPFGNYSKYNTINNIEEYDDFLLFDSYYVDKIKEIGQENAHFLPIGVDPEQHSEKIPFNKRKYQNNISFIGSHCNNRQETLENLSKYNPQIWGYRWPKVKKISLLNQGIHKKIYNAAKSIKDLNKTCELFNLSKININIHHPHTKNGVNFRFFEIPATKSFQISDYYSDMKTMFNKKEMIYYNDIKDLKEKVDYYLNNKEERHNISLAGYKKVIKEHTDYHRMKKMLTQIKV